MIKSIAFRTLLLISILCISCSKDGEEEIPDTIAPTVSFSIKGLTQSNAQPPIVGNTIEIEIDAQDAKGISKVEAFMNDSKVGEDTQAPFQITIDLTSFAKKLIGKGTVISKTQTLYTLKVSATDLAGNVASVEQDIIVDNEMPTITEVSLENNTVIGGGENLVTFIAQDNKEIMSLEVKVNDDVVETTAPENNTYTFNIDSSLLEDGPNNLTITVADQANNTATYNAPFVVDNTGPQINLEGLTAASIVDENAQFTISGEDLFSDVTSLKIFVNDDVILSSEDGSELGLNFNPDDYATGDATLRIEGIDALGNESTLETDFQIKRLLLKINVPNDFLDPTVSKFYVFASSSSGELLDIKQMEFNTSTIRLNTLEDVAPDTEYMLNFAYLYSGAAESSYIKTIQNVKRSTLGTIDLKTPERKSFSAQNTYQASAMPFGVSIISESTDHNSSYLPDATGNSFYIEDYNLEFTNAISNQHYIYFHNTSNNNYSYQIVDKPLASDFYLDYNNFITDGVETRYFNGSAIQDPNKFTDLMLYGYLNATDFDNGIKHRIWGSGYQNIIIMNGSGYRYEFNTNFYNYSYKATMENYRVEAIGAPLDYYTGPDWTIDYTYSNIDKTFTLNSTGTTHNIGKIIMNYNSPDSNYNWKVLYNSQTTTEVILPQLPEELKSWNINNYYSTGDLTTEQIEVKKYDGLDTYDAFLQTVIKNNEYNQLNVSDKVESIFKTNVGAYSSRPDFSFYY